MEALSLSNTIIVATVLSFFSKILLLRSRHIVQQVNMAADFGAGLVCFGILQESSSSNLGNEALSFQTISRNDWKRLAPKDSWTTGTP